VRQGRLFPYYGISLEDVRSAVLESQNTTFVGSYLEEKLVGFILLVHGDNIAIISQILSLQEHWDKALNNALVAKAIEVCAQKQIQYVMYGRMGNHPSLDAFKENNSFAKCVVKRFYMPLTAKGKVATALGLQRELKDALPEGLKLRLLPAVEWASSRRARKLVKSQPPTQENAPA
jgi:hypothetical protein